MADYLSDFNVADGAVPSGQLTFLSGSGTISSNRLLLTAGSPVKLAVRPETLTRDNYIVTGIVRAGAGASTAQRGGIAFCVQDTTTYYYLTFKSGTYGNVFLYRYKNFTSTLLQQHPSSGNINMPVDTDHKLEARVSGIGTATTTIEVYLNDALLFTFNDSADPITSPGRAGFYFGDAAGASYQFDDLDIQEGLATPVVTIAEPDATVMCALGETTYDYTFNATANDEEDGDLTAGLTWRYRTDGGAWNVIAGTGASVAQTLPIGVNEIEASVTDSNAMTGTKIVTITVQAYDFGGVTPAAGGFLDGDTYTGNGVRLLITKQPTNGRVFATEAGGATLFPDGPEVTEMTFSYRIQDQGGISNEATVTCTINTGAPASLNLTSPGLVSAAGGTLIPQMHNQNLWVGGPAAATQYGATSDQDLALPSSGEHVVEFMLKADGTWDWVAVGYCDSPYANEYVWRFDKVAGLWRVWVAGVEQTTVAGTDQDIPAVGVTAAGDVKFYLNGGAPRFTSATAIAGAHRPMVLTSGTGFTVAEDCLAVEVITDYFQASYGSANTIAGSAPLSLTDVFQLNDNGTLAGAFGYIGRANLTHGNRFTRVDVTQDATENGATAPVYMALADDATNTDMVSVGTDIIAFGIEVLNHTGATPDIHSGYVVGQILIADGVGGAAGLSYRLTGSADRTVIFLPFGQGDMALTGTPDGDTGVELGADIAKAVIYVNGATGQFGWGFYDSALGQWVDKGYDATGSMPASLIPLMSADNDAYYVAALDNTMVSQRFRADKEFLSEVPFLVSLGAKTWNKTPLA